MKIGKGIKLYAIVSQYLAQTVVLLFLGVFLGGKLDTKLGLETTFSGIFGVLGIFIGLSMFITFVIKNGGNNGKR